MIKAVIFDCFGVLVGRGFWNQYKHYGGDPEKDALFIDEYINAASLGSITNEEFRQAIAGKLGMTPVQYHALATEDDVPNQDIFGFIRDELKPHYKIGLLSNANLGDIESHIPAVHLSELFDAVVVSAHVGLIKPDPQIFQLAADRLGVEPADAVFTDDHSEYLEGAKSIGMNTILYKSFDVFKAEFASLTEATASQPEK